MARGSSQAQTAATSAQNLSNTLQSNATPLYGALAPELEAEAAAPAGINPTDMAAMETASRQNAGGTQAAATGQGALLAARTRNRGAGAAATAASARSAGQQQSQEDLQAQLANQRLKQQQQQAGLTGEENLYNTELGGAENALGEVAQNVTANTGAENAGWDWAKYILDPALAAASGASGSMLKAAGG